MSEDEDKGHTTSGPMEMGMGMAKKMMAQMGKGGPNPMAMMQKMMGRMAEGGQAPPPMMQMCIGMCAEMLTAIKRTSEMAAFASPELHDLFAEWLGAMEAQVIQHLQKKGATDLADIAKRLGIGEESAAYLLAHLAAQGKIVLRAESKETGE
jgi:hypothetical protein